MDLCRDFDQEFPAVDLRVDTQSAGVVASRVRDRAATIGVVSLPGLPVGLERKSLTPIVKVPVVAFAHPLAKEAAPIATVHLAETIQIILSERHDAGAHDQCVRAQPVASLAPASTTAVAQRGRANMWAMGMQPRNP